MRLQEEPITEAKFIKTIEKKSIDVFLSTEQAEIDDDFMDEGIGNAIKIAINPGTEVKKRPNSCKQPFARTNRISIYLQHK